MCIVVGVKFINGIYLLGVKNLMFPRTKIWGYGQCPQVTELEEVGVWIFTWDLPDVHVAPVF